MNLAHLILRQWRLRPARTLLSIASVAIAAAAVLGVALAQANVRQGYRKLIEAVEGRPALEIVASAGGRFASADVPSVADIPGVAAEAGVITRATMARVNGKRFRGVLVGVSPEASAIWDTLPLVEGERASEPDEALLSAELATSLKAGVGDRLIVLSRRGPRSTTIVGLVDSKALGDIAPAAAIVMPLAAVQGLYELGDVVDRVRVLLDASAQRADVEAAIAGRLPEALAVQAPLGRMELTDSMLRSTELALQFAGALTMAVAVFIILNTLRMNFGERRRDVAVLRVLGVTSKQLVGLQLLEGIGLGLIGSLLGIPLALGVGHALTLAMQGLVQSELPPPELPYWMIPAALVLGPALAAVASLIPAIQSRNVSAKEALGDGESRRAERLPYRAIAGGFVLWVVAVALLLSVVMEMVRAEAAIPAGIMMLIGFVAVIPALLPPLVNALARVLPAWTNLEGALAADQLLGRPTRTGLTVGVLVAAVGTGLGLGNAIINNVSDVRGWYARVTASDILLTSPAASDASAEPRDRISPREEIAGRPGVDFVVETRYFPIRADGVPALCVIHEVAPQVVLPWSLEPEAADAARAALKHGEAVVGSVLAKRLGIAAGSDLRLELQGRVVNVRVAAAVRDYTQGGLAVFLDRDAAAKLIDLGPAAAYTVTLEPDVPIAPVIRDLEARLAGEGFVISSYSELRKQLDRLIDAVVAALWGLMAIAFVIGGVAVANTLTMSVLEQTRELGLLRIIGMTRGQVRKVVLCESLLMGFVGIALGSLAGLTTAFIIHLCNEPLLGQSLPFAFHGWLVAANAAVALVIVILAAWSPVERAARLDLLTAIAYE